MAGIITGIAYSAGDKWWVLTIAILVVWLVWLMIKKAIKLALILLLIVAIMSYTGYSHQQLRSHYKVYKYNEKTYGTINNTEFSTYNSDLENKGNSKIITFKDKEGFI